MFLKSQKNYCMLYLLELVSEIKTINLDGPKPGGLSLVSSFSILTNYDMKRGWNIPATLYHLAPLVMPSSKYSSGYRSSQGCPLCIREFSCTHITQESSTKNSLLPPDFSKRQQLLLVHSYSGRKQKMYPLTCEYALASCLKTLSSGDWLYCVSPSLSSS